MTIRPKVFSDFKRPEFKKPPDLKNAVWQKTNGKCYYCGCDLVPFGGEKNSFNIDHVVAVRHGGSNELDNLVPACKSRNSRKGAR